MTVVSIIKKIYIVDSLKVNMLIEVNVLVLERMMLNINKKTVIIKNCQDVVATINVMFKKNLNIKRIVRSKSRVVVSSHALVEIFI